MGKSASGKDHIYARLAAHEGLGLKKLVLYTTRPIRAEEENGKQYYFVDDKKLEEFRSSGNLIEARAYHTVHGIGTILQQMTVRWIWKMLTIWESVHLNLM